MGKSVCPRCGHWIVYSGKGNPRFLQCIGFGKQTHPVMQMTTVH